MFTEQYFNNKAYKVYNNANFSIVLDRSCNADCKFCVEALRNHSNNKRNCDYERVLSKMRDINTSISITGGEPTANSRFIELVNLVDKYKFRKTVVTTNGSFLIRDNFKILDSLLNFNHLNISKAHFDERENRAVMRYKTDDYFSNEDLISVMNHIKEKESKLRVRLSCVLTQSTIKSKEDIQAYADFYSDYVDNIVFRELMKSDEIENEDKKEFYQTNAVDMTPILKEISEDKEFKLINETNGYYYNVKVYEYKGMILCFEQADLRNMYNRKEYEIYEFVLHESGRLCGSWNDSETHLGDFYE